MTLTLSNLIPTCQKRVETCFTNYLQKIDAPAPILCEAMRYGVLNGGKRIRPLLVYATGLALGATLESLDAAACAVEVIHSYSLIHDDLPAMDNADLRRGKPSCHKAYNEAMAILAGDALQALAFEIIATHSVSLTPAQQMEMIFILSRASGPFGMAGGQALDITIMDNCITLDNLLKLYSLKTGALLQASVELGVISANITDKKIRTALEKYAKNLGLAFQIHDDLLDMQSTTTELGKPQGIDSTNNKTTYPVLCGIEKTKEKIHELTYEALASIDILGDKGAILKQLADYLLQRTY